MSLHTVTTFKKQMDGLKAEHQLFREKEKALRDVIMSEKLLEEDATFHDNLSNFENYIITSPEISKAILEAFYVKKQEQQPPQTQPMQASQPTLGQETAKITTLHVALLASVFSILFVAVYLRLLPGEILVWLAFITIFMIFLPNIFNLIKRKVKPPEAALPEKTPLEWITEQIEWMRRRYKAEYFLIRLQRSSPSRVPEYKYLDDAVRWRSQQRLKVLRAELTPVVGKISVIVNQAVAEQINILNSCIVSASQSMATARGAGP